MLELIKQPWPWYISGAAMALVMFSMLLFGKSFGVSSNLRTICAMCGAGNNTPFFDFKWKDQIWNLVFILGSLIGGYLASTFLSHPDHVQVSTETIADLEAIGVQNIKGFLPKDLFNIELLFTLKGLAFFVSGGFLVGFGTRYANGCTSGHSITGLSTLQLGSLIATIGFFIGGLIMTHLFLPYLLPF